MPAYPTQAAKTTCFICKKPGHWASQCPLRKKSRFQHKIMDLFQTGYDPGEWELVSNHSDGEYLSLTDDDSYSPHDFNYDSNNSEISTIS